MAPHIVRSAPVVLVAMLAGCIAAVPPDDGVSQPASAPGLSQGDRPVPTGSRWLDADRCARCHAGQHADWSQSRHAASFTNPVFQASFENARMRGWCLNCHAPLPAQQRAIWDGQPRAPLVAQGVNCAACHVRDGEILTANPPSRLARLAHRTRYTSVLQHSEFCGGCHQFRAPTHDGTRFQVGDPLQDTLTEWQHSDAAERGQHCQDCHMPDGRHRFPGAHDPDTVRAALQVWTEEDGQETHLNVETTAQVGHSVPSGDPFRRLELRACADDDCAVLVGQRSLGRVHRFDGVTWYLEADHSLAAPGDARPSSVRWTLPSGTTRWEVRYAYAAARDAPRLPPEEAYTLIAAGTVDTRQNRTAEPQD